MATTKSPRDGLRGMIFCITGTCSQSRSVMQRWLELHGATVKSTVTAEATHLLAGKNPGNDKITAAGRRAIPVVDEQWVVDYLNGLLDIPNAVKVGIQTDASKPKPERLANDSYGEF